MKRTIIALVTAGLPFAAAAEVTLYGQIKSSVSAGQVRIKGGSGTEKSPTVTKINDNTSRIGFKGSEKIGDDLKAIWQVEQRTSVLNESNSTNWGSRDSFIGLEGGFGKIRAGHMNNLLNEMDTIDTWLYKSSALGLGAYVRTGSRTTSVRYDSFIRRFESESAIFSARQPESARQKHSCRTRPRSVQCRPDLRKQRVHRQSGLQPAQKPLCRNGQRRKKRRPCRSPGKLLRQG